MFPPCTDFIITRNNMIMTMTMLESFTAHYLFIAHLNRFMWLDLHAIDPRPQRFYNMHGFQVGCPSTIPTEQHMRLRLEVMNSMQCRDRL